MNIVPAVYFGHGTSDLLCTEASETKPERLVNQQQIKFLHVKITSKPKHRFPFHIRAAAASLTSNTSTCSQTGFFFCVQMVGEREPGKQSRSLAAGALAAVEGV